MNYRLEVIGIPVADVDRAKAFYVEQVGFALDHDVEPKPGMRVVQITPPRVALLRGDRQWHAARRAGDFTWPAAGRRYIDAARAEW